MTQGTRDTSYVGDCLDACEEPDLAEQFALVLVSLRELAARSLGFDKRFRTGGPAGTAVRLERLREPHFQELSQFCRGLELWNRLQFLKEPK
jgi:hypothetical protein